MVRKLLVMTLAAASLVVLPSVSASAFSSYVLSDHPNRGKQNQDYGARLDAISMFFSFSLPGARTVLSFDDSSASMTGTMVRDSDNMVFDLTYTFGGVEAYGPDGFKATDGSGTLVKEDGSETIYLGYKQGNSGVENGFAFLFGSDGHRLSDPDGYAGRGWLTVGFAPDNMSDAGTNDFLFTASPVPLPAPVLMLGAALLGIGAAGMRRNARQAQAAA